MDADTITIDCINAARCGGRVTLRLSEQAVILPSGDDFPLVGAVPDSHTCACMYSEEDVAALMDHGRFGARQALHR